MEESEGKGKKKGKKKNKDEDEAEEGEPQRVAFPLDALREVAFDAVAGTLDSKELLQAMDDDVIAIRERALDEMNNRGEEDAIEMAEDFFTEVARKAQERLLGARILAAARGTGSRGLLSQGDDQG